MAGSRRSRAQIRDVLDEGATDPATPEGRANRHLLDVRVSRDEVDDDVADRAVATVDRYPGSPGALVAGKLVDGERIVARDLVHTDVAERAPGLDLDLTQYREIVRARALRIAISSGAAVASFT